MDNFMQGRRPPYRRRILRASLYNGAHCVTAARMVKLVDTRDLKSLAFGRTGSIPVPGTNRIAPGHDAALRPFV